MSDPKKPHFMEYVDNTFARRAFDKHLTQCVGVQRRFVVLCMLLKWPFLKLRYSKLGRIAVVVWILAHPLTCWFIQRNHPTIEGLGVFDPIPLSYGFTTVVLLLVYCLRDWLEENLPPGFWGNVAIGAFYFYLAADGTLIVTIIKVMLKPAGGDGVPAP